MEAATGLRSSRVKERKDAVEATEREVRRCGGMLSVEEWKMILTSAMELVRLENIAASKKSSSTIGVQAALVFVERLVRVADSGPWRRLAAVVRSLTSWASEALLSQKEGAGSYARILEILLASESYVTVKLRPKEVQNATKALVVLATRVRSERRCSKLQRGNQFQANDVDAWRALERLAVALRCQDCIESVAPIVLACADWCASDLSSVAQEPATPHVFGAFAVCCTGRTEEEEISTWSRYRRRIELVSAGSTTKRAISGAISACLAPAASRRCKEAALKLCARVPAAVGQKNLIQAVDDLDPGILPTLRAAVWKAALLKQYGAAPVDTELWQRLLFLLRKTEGIDTERHALSVLELVCLELSAKTKPCPFSLQDVEIENERVDFDDDTPLAGYFVVAAQSEKGLTKVIEERLSWCLSLADAVRAIMERPRGDADPIPAFRTLGILATASRKAIDKVVECAAPQPQELTGIWAQCIETWCGKYLHRAVAVLGDEETSSKRRRLAKKSSELVEAALATIQAALPLCFISEQLIRSIIRATTFAPTAARRTYAAAIRAVGEERRARSDIVLAVSALTNANDAESAILASSAVLTVLFGIDKNTPPNHSLPIEIVSNDPWVSLSMTIMRETVVASQRNLREPRHFRSGVLIVLDAALDNAASFLNDETFDDSIDDFLTSACLASALLVSELGHLLPAEARFELEKRAARATTIVSKRLDSTDYISDTLARLGYAILYATSQAHNKVLTVARDSLSLVACRRAVAQHSGGHDRGNLSVDSRGNYDDDVDVSSDEDMKLQPRKKKARNTVGQENTEIAAYDDDDGDVDDDDMLSFDDEMPERRASNNTQHSIKSNKQIKASSQSEPLIVEDRRTMMWLALAAAENPRNVRKLVPVFACAGVTAVGRFDAAVFASRLFNLKHPEAGLEVLENAFSTTMLRHHLQLDADAKRASRATQAYFIALEGFMCQSQSSCSSSFQSRLNAALYPDRTLANETETSLPVLLANDPRARAARINVLANKPNLDERKARSTIKYGLLDDHLVVRLAAAEALYILAKHDLSDIASVHDIRWPKCSDGSIKSSQLTFSAMAATSCLAAADNLDALNHLIREEAHRRSRGDDFSAYWAAAGLARAARLAGYTSAESAVNSNLSSILIAWCQPVDANRDHSGPKFLDPTRLNSFPLKRWFSDGEAAYRIRLRTLLAPLIAASAFESSDKLPAETLQDLGVDSPKCLIRDEEPTVAAAVLFARAALAHTDLCQSFMANFVLEPQGLRPLVQSIFAAVSDRENILVEWYHTVNPVSDDFCWVKAAEEALRTLGTEMFYHDRGNTSKTKQKRSLSASPLQPCDILRQCCAADLMLGLGEKLLKTQPIDIKNSFEAFDLALRLLGDSDEGALIAATAALVSVIECDNGSIQFNTRRRKFAMRSLFEIASHDLHTTLRSTIFVVAVSILGAYYSDDPSAGENNTIVDGERDDGLMILKKAQIQSKVLRSRAEKLLRIYPKIEEGVLDDLLRIRRTLLYDKKDGRTHVGVPTLEPGSGPLDRPRRVKWLADLRLRLRRKDTLDRQSDIASALKCFVNVTTSARERSLARDCLGELARTGAVSSMQEDEVITAFSGKGDDTYDCPLSRRQLLARELARTAELSCEEMGRCARESLWMIAATSDGRELLLKTVHAANGYDVHCSILASYSDQSISHRRNTPFKRVTVGETPATAEQYGQCVSTRWAQEFATGLIDQYFTSTADPRIGDDGFLAGCRPICAVSSAFSRMALPVLVYEVIANRSRESIEIIGARKEAQSLISESIIKILESDDMFREDKATALDILDFVRARDTNVFLGKEGTGPSNFALIDNGKDVPFYSPIHKSRQLLAPAANAARRPASAIFYATAHLRIYGHGEQVGSASALLNAYDQLGDADLLRSLSLSTNYFERDGNQALERALARAEESWPSLLCASEAMEEDARCYQISRGLRGMGLAHLVDAYSQSLAHDSVILIKLKEVREESAWRCSRWEDGSDHTNLPEGRPGFHSTFRTALGRLARRDIAGSLRALRIVKNYIDDGIEPQEKHFAELSRLVAVAEARDIVLAVGNEISGRGTLYSLVSSCMRCIDTFDDLVYASREAWLRSARDALNDNFASKQLLDQAIWSQIVKTAETATRFRKFGAAAGAIARLRVDLDACIDKNEERMVCEIDDPTGYPHWECRMNLANAKILWARGRTEEAWRRVLRMMPPREATLGSLSSLQLEVLCLAGTWAVEARSMVSSTVIRDYLRPAAKNATDRDASAAAAHFALGEYVARLYMDAIGRFESAEWQKSERAAAEREKELRDCEAHQRKLQSDLKRKASRGDAAEVLPLQNLIANIINVIRKLQREIKDDKASRRAAIDAVNIYLSEALGALFNVIARTYKSYDLAEQAATRVISIWFHHGSTSSNASAHVAAKLQKFEDIPVAAFAPLLYQLASRIGNETANENGVLSTLVERLCCVIPDHGILQIHSLSKGTDLRTAKKGREQFERSHCSKGSETNNRVAAANKILHKLRSNSKLKGSVNALTEVCEAYLDLATFSIEESVADDPKFVEGIPFSQLHIVANGETRRNEVPQFFLARLYSQGDELNDVIAAKEKIGVPIISQLPGARGVARGGTYAAPGLWKFVSSVKTTPSGLHRPKIIRCIGDDGIIRRELLKDNEDMRQDAVMEQVFDAVNDILVRKCTDGTGRNVRKPLLRTYNIVPLSPQVGIIEWVEGTQAIQDYLIGAKGESENKPIKATIRRVAAGAHSRYHPNDRSHTDCLRQLARLRKSHVNALLKRGQEDEAYRSLRECFEKIRKDFHPAFRYFFVEFFGEDAQTWLHRTRAYARSVAASSMVGHVLGIGDRHAQNILIDKKSAEVVHIDFGIAFEQGKLLSIPETVPFRLTRDIVDGMGIAGTDGDFFTVSCTVMNALREHVAPLMTILDVLIHDPLYHWMLTPREISRRQKDSDQGESEERTSKRVRHNGADDVNHQEAYAAAGPARALLRAKQKLHGYLDAESGGQSLSVEGQVKQLIAEAVDVGNLSRLFAGWAPWL